MIARTADASSTVPILNPTEPIGEAGSPDMFVRFDIPNGRRGGSQRSLRSLTLLQTHAVQCRVVRNIAHHRRGKGSIDDQMRELRIGYNDGVGRYGRAAVEAITGNSAPAFDSEVLKLIKEADKIGKLECKLMQHAEVAKTLLQAWMIVCKMDSVFAKFRDTNLNRGKRPGPERLTQAILPHLSGSGIAQLSFGNMASVALYGLVNPAKIYHNLSFLTDPFELLIFVGRCAVYGNQGFLAGTDQLKRLCSIVFEGHLPKETISYDQHCSLFQECCAVVKRTWISQNMNAHLLRLDRPLG